MARFRPRRRVLVAVTIMVAVATVGVGCMLSFDPAPDANTVGVDGGEDGAADARPDAHADAGSDVSAGEDGAPLPGDERDAASDLICIGRACDAGCCYRGDAAATPFECTAPVSCDEYYRCTATSQCYPGVCCKRPSLSPNFAFLAACETVDSCLGTEGGVTGQVLCQSFDQDCPKSASFITCTKPREPFYVCQ